VTDEAQFGVQCLADIEDRLFPILDLDVWERCLYYHLLRHTRVLGVGSVSVGLVTIARANGVSEDSYSYDADRFLTTITRPDGIVVTHVPDAFERLSQVQYPQGALS
jgi:hypothetical protein